MTGAECKVAEVAAVGEAKLELDEEEGHLKNVLLCIGL